MRLSLSVRVAEQFSNKREASMSLETLTDMAVAEGYQALCMRASQIGIHTPVNIAAQKSLHIAKQGLKISMVTGDFTIPENSEDGTMALRQITPYLDLADSLGANLLRVTMKKEEDIRRL